MGASASAGRCKVWLSATHVRFWHKADVDADAQHVRFEGNNGHDADGTRPGGVTVGTYEFSEPHTNDRENRDIAASILRVCSARCSADTYGPREDSTKAPAAALATSS